MQHVHFRTVDDFLDFLPIDEREITEYLRALVLDNLPGCHEKLSYNVPYYSIHTRICFIWPASVFWGNRKTFDGVRMGFTQGYLMKDPLGLLERGKRKQVFRMTCTRPDSIDSNVLSAYLDEARQIDQMLADHHKFC